MTDQGRDPHREARRAGDGDNYILGPDGKVLRDRYGRPVQKRPSPSADRRWPRREDSPAARSDRPRQVPPPRQQPPSPAREGYWHAPQETPAPMPASTSAQAASYAPTPRQYRGAGAPAQRPHRRAKRVNPLRRGLGCFGWLIAIVVVLTLAFTLWSDSQLTRIQALPKDQVANTAGTNWLLVGSDSRQGLSEEEQAELGTGGDVGVGRTDTIMLLHIPSSGKAQLVSIPRDSYVDVPGFGSDKINAAFTYGGAPLLTETVEQNTGLHIDHYAEIGMGGLANIVDSVGGVDVCIKDVMEDPLAGINLQPGCQTLKGPDALGYVRTRATALGDLDRVERQREFFAALLNKITAPSTMINPFKVISLVKQTAGSFIVDDGDHVWHLARVALAMASGVETQTIPVGGFQDTEVGNVLLWDEAGAQQLWDSLR